VAVGQTAAVTVNLGSVPADGYTSVEFTCTYAGAVAEASNITDAGLFGADAAVAVNGPQNGSFIVAIAGSNSRKATASGTAFTFSLKALQAGQTSVECTARVSAGDNTLTQIVSSPAALTVLGIASPTPTAIPATSTPTVVPSTTTATPTTVPTTVSTVNGQVHASKPVAVSLYKADASLAASVTANASGAFSLTAPAGAYTVVASASGFLKAQGSVTLLDAQTSTLPTISLLAGDIDGNNVIDQYDAMTIGMNYNAASPAAADLNNDGNINILDLELLARNYRASGALAWPEL
jgi:hypothetical protein